MASGSNYLTTYYAKRIIGDTAAASASNALLQTGTGVGVDTWILHRDNRTDDLYGINYYYDDSSNGTADKIEFYGGYSPNSIDTPTAWIQLDVGDLYILGNAGLGDAPDDTHQLYVYGTTKLLGNTGIGTDADTTYKLWVNTNAYFNIGEASTVGNETTYSDDVTDRQFVIGYSGYRYLSFGGAGIQAYTHGSPDTISVLKLNENGGQTHIGGSQQVDGAVGIGYNPDTSGNTYKLYVNGTTYFNGNTTHNGIDYFANGTTYYVNNSGEGSLLNLGLNGTDTTYKLYVNGTSNFTDLVTVSYGSTHKGIKFGDAYINAITGGKLILQNLSELRFGADDWAYNKWAGLKYDATDKIIYLGIADGTVFTKSSGDGLSGGTVAMPAIQYLSINGKVIVNAGDAWLRINGSGDHTSGVYFGSSITRTDGQFQIGASGTKFYADNSGNGYFSATLGIGGTDTTYKLYVDGKVGITNSLTLLNTDNASKSTINFSRAGHNYINIPSGGSLSFTVGGSAGDKIQATLSLNSFTCYSDARSSLGTDSVRWKGLYSTTGHFFPASGDSNYNQGIRIHNNSDWSLIMLCAADNTGNTGTSANSWLIGNKAGNFYISRNGSNTSSSAILKCESNVWSWNGIATGDISGNAGTATKLAASVKINNTDFDGSADITTSRWGTARNITIKDSDSTNAGTAVSVNGSAAVTLLLPSTIKASLTGSSTSVSWTSSADVKLAYNGGSNVDRSPVQTFSSDGTNNTSVMRLRTYIYGTDSGDHAGDIYIQLAARNYKTNASTPAWGNWGGITIYAKKDGTFDYGVSSAANFRSVISASASNHVHGNITNDGDITATAPTIASGDQIIINDSSASKITNGPTFDGSTETKCLTQKGTWASFTNNAGTVTSITISAGDGITVGSATTAITTSGTRTISITGMDTSSGSESQCLTKKGTWKSFGTSNLTIGNSSTTAMAGNTTVTNVHIGANITTNANYPVVFATSNKDTTAAKNEGLQKSGAKFYFNPSTGLLTSTKVANAIWNDYAEYRECDALPPGCCVQENDNGYLTISDRRLIPGASIITDTWGYVQGETETAHTPIAVSGRVLAYTFWPREEYHAGMAVCSGPNGTIDIMTREEICDYPDAIVGIVSEIPSYEEWGTGKVKVDGRIWIKIK